METENTDNTDNTDSPQSEGADTGADRRPIGYWLRTVDAYISREFARAFDDEGVSRRDWMLLNVLSGDVDAPGFAERLARKGKRLRGLEQRGWVEEAGDGTWNLTDEGRTAKERLGAVVDGIRGRVAGAVSPEDFATTLSSLEAIARELGWDESRRGPGSGFGRRFGRGFQPGFGRGFGRGLGEGFGPRHGFGEHHGYSEGFGPRHGMGPDFGEGFSPYAMHGHSGHPHHRGHGPRGDHGDCQGHGERSHGGHGHRGHDDRGHGRRHHDAERAYERGFDAGYTRGQTGS